MSLFSRDTYLYIESEVNLTKISDKKQEKFEKEADGFIKQLYHESGKVFDLCEPDFLFDEIYTILESRTGLSIKRKGNNWSKTKITNKIPNKENIKLNGNKTDDERRDGVMDLGHRKNIAALQILKSSRDKVHTKLNQHSNFMVTDKDHLTMDQVRVLLNSRLKKDGISLSNLVLEERNEARA
ncbi:hypothetical protein [Neobacillus drentensis]|uniref:hypothetical protein n=1 Tax=Neobacillus drentensis TaxID=220684 RepID=UPI002FFE1741